MKRLIAALAVLVVFAVALAGCAVWYVQPQEKLDLTYTDVSSFGKISDMIRTRQFEFELTENDLNQLLKKGLSENRQIRPGVEVTGARFALSGSRLDAYLNMLLNDNVKAGFHLVYRLKANGSQLTAAYEGADIRGFSLPGDWVSAPNFSVDLNAYLPQIVGVKEMAFPGSSIQVKLHLK